MAVMVLSIVILYGISITIIRRKERMAAKDKQWQNLYLQSTIDEFNSYNKNMPLEISEIEDSARKQIVQVKSNWNEMKKKADEAMMLLL